MPAEKRLQKELIGIRESNFEYFRNIEQDDTTFLKWQGLILPDKAPYNIGAFRIEINFPAKYPFKPPKVHFLTNIYHPNIGQKGEVYLNILKEERWKPSTLVEDVIYELIGLVNEPEPENAVRKDLAEEFKRHPKRFTKHAEAFTKEFSEKRSENY